MLRLPMLLLAITCIFISGCSDRENTSNTATSEKPTIMLIVRGLQSKLPDDEVTRRFKERMPAFQALPGLIQKYYTYDEKNKTWAGIYLWRDQASLDAYLKSDLKKTIASAYELKGPPTIERFEIVDLLRK